MILTYYDKSKNSMCYLNIEKNKVTQFDDAFAEKLQNVASNFIELSGAAMAGVPISYPGKGIENVEIIRTEEETAENRQIQLVSSGKAKEMICKDITADYVVWSPENGKTVENYAKTLLDGSYRVADDAIGRYEIEVFTVENGQQWRIIRDYTDEFCYISLYCGDDISLYINAETGYAQVGGRTLLTNENVPLPTAADIGKVLTATAANRAVWMSVVNAEEVAV